MPMTLSCRIHGGSIFYHLGVKNEDRRLKFCTLDVLVGSSNIYSGFLKILPKKDFMTNIQKLYFQFFGSSKKSDF